MISSSPIVSVVLPVYNAGEYLRPCLDSLVNQTLRDIEIICVLDCPTDGSDKVVEEYAAFDNRIIVIRNETNLHIGETRNKGLRVAHGEYIGFSDHDDIRELDMYERLCTIAEQGQYDVVMSGKFVKENFKNHLDCTNLCRRCLHALICRIGTAHVTPHLFRKSFLEANQLSFVNTRFLFGEDILFNINALCRLQDDSQITVCSDVFYHHIETGKNTGDLPSYCSISKLSLFINKCHDLIKESRFYNELNADMSILLLKMSYSILRKEIIRNGFKKALGTFKSTVVGDDLCRQIIKRMSVTMKGLTLPKRVFVLWLKWMCD